MLEENEVVLSYRLPWSALPGRRARAGLRVALLHVQWLIQDVTVVVVEPLAAGPLTHHQASPPSSSTGLGALRETNKKSFRMHLKDGGDVTDDKDL